MSRKAFIESHGGACRNWRWSWSFVNHDQRMVIFGAWDTQTTGEGSLILDEMWERSDLGRRQPGYAQALEHIRLVESGAYKLLTFPITYSDAQKDASNYGPATIGDFTAELRQCRLTKVGTKWYAV